MICCLREHVQGMKTELVFSLDEIGMSEWENRKERKMIIMKTMEGQTMYHRESRSVRHISIVTCITAGGESLTPYILTSQDSDAIRKRLMRHGVRLGVDFVLRQWLKPYINRKLLLEYINAIFIPYLNQLRESKEFEACEAVLLMDNCSLDMSDDFVAVLTSVQVQIITFAPHTTYVFQMLDVFLFSVLKSMRLVSNPWTRNN
jgi:hypothetical protein